MGALPINVARSWTRPEAMVNQREGCAQAAALRQNPLHRAISSAVEHLPYKEIVAGSIPASPTRCSCSLEVEKSPAGHVTSCREQNG
jgi:hypothetical protein